MDKGKVTLLWSGGWDGSFRFMQLMESNVIIQPVYIIDRNRKSVEYELKAMKKIIEMAKERFAKATVLDTVFYEKEWIQNNCKDEKVSKAFRYLREKYSVGKQYEWFALLTKYENIKMESAVVHQYHGKVENAIDGEGVLAKLENDFLSDRYVVLPKEGNDIAYTVFGNLILPVIKLTKKDEERIARDKGWIEILQYSWFCHSPINGEPCGLCGPCDDAMNTGMEWRMPQSSQFRYKHKKIFKIILKIRNKLGL